ncbi:hypothetical protein [Burkholderia thailandensis]|uniref:Uncharacterized protein n=1 Tax=Burkholderia thailandensis TaxID=57975 RepID=A0AAW9CJI6_BURTH|nr:hypothetical protein [Burkholderia thailandensis]MBS2129315.1 hypothetical protein [Burkholderia thailandensis]MCS3392339.1 hypothetical protein [Burkholderia thailandensis]MCS3399066.1 hypothetical protein [Burkholderia thailandensis]MCS6478044.1 hypothetical protein [Burkholderia thailandensis]MCS6503946.1 hypothetical protein [Burkholderia thailandensis]
MRAVPSSVRADMKYLSGGAPGDERAEPPNEAALRGAMIGHRQRHHSESRG